MAHAYSHLYQLPTTGLRFFTVYGPWGRPDMAYFLFIKAILAGQPIQVFNHGEMQRDFAYIDDIVEGVVKVMAKPAVANNQWDATAPRPDSSKAPYKIYNIGAGKPLPLIDFITTIEQKLGRPAIKQYLPMQPGDVVTTYADTSGLERDFGYKPTTSLQTGMAHTVDWYLAFYG